MAVPSGFCEAEITFVCLSSDTTIQIFIGLTPITNPFPVTTADTQLTLQAVITANTIGVGVIITIQNDSVFPLTCSFMPPHTGILHLLVQVASTTQITDLLTVTDSNEGFQSISSTTFTCNLAPPPIPKKKNRRRNAGAFYDGNICFNRYDKLGREMNCPQQIISGRIIYTKISTDQQKCCYKKID